MIFTESKYTKQYYNIIYNAVTTRFYKNKKQAKNAMGYCERHHIIPSSLGGGDEPSNLVWLTAREHFICHWLLTKMTTNKNDYEKMINALILMKGKGKNQKQQRYINARAYEKAKKEYSNICNETRKGEQNAFFNKTHTLEQKEKWKKDRKGVYKSWNEGFTKETDDRLKKTAQSISRAKKGVPNPKVSVALKGRKPSNEALENLKISVSDGRMKWWNNGIKNVRSSSCPGSEWNNGRLKSSMSKNFTGAQLRKYDYAVLKELTTGRIFTLSFDDLKELKERNKNVVGRELKPRKRSHSASIQYVIIEFVKEGD